VSQRYLTQEGRDAGYTVLLVPPYSSEAFFTMARLLLARGSFEIHLLRLLEDPNRQSLLTEAQAAWNAWQTWTRRLAASFERLAGGKDATIPCVPEALLGLIRLLDGVNDG
jgi:hypothetical protein